MRKKLLTIIFALAASVTIGRAEIIGGSCGDNLTWSLDTEEGTLVISGTGEMTSIPWNDYDWLIGHIRIEEGVTNVIDYAFMYSSCEDVSLPASLKKIGKSAFFSCRNLKRITIPESVESVGESAFDECMNMTTATWNTINCQDIHESVFGYYYGGVVDTIIIGEKVESISLNAFNTDTRKITIYWNAKHYGEVTNKNQCPLRYNIKELIIGDKVEHLPAYFCYNIGIKSLVISNSVTSIGESAFERCTALETITLSDNLASIPDRLFYNCNKLSSIVIPNSVKSIGNEAFYACENLSSVIIGDGCESIGERGFFICKNLEKVILGNNVSSIGNSAFYCEYGKPNKLTSIELPNSLISIGESAFSGSGLTQIRIPENVTYVGNGAFSCDALQRVEWNAESAQIAPLDPDKWWYHSGPFIAHNISEFIFGENVESIPAGLCYKNHSIASIKVPNNVKSVGELAFYEVANIEYHGSLDASLWGAYSLNGHVEGQLVYESPSKTQIRSCTSLQKDPIHIPSSVTSIDHLYYSPAVEMICDPTTPPKVLNLPEYLRLVHVPAGTKDAYTKAWNTENILYAEPTETDIVEVVNDSLNWAYNPASKILKLIGYGKMPDYLSENHPWKDYKTIIDSVWIDPRITYIGNYAFYGMSHLKSLTIPETVVSMGYNLIMESGVEEIHYYSNAGNVGIVINDGIISGPQGGWMVGESQRYFPFKGANVEKTQLHIGSNVKIIPDFLFMGTVNLGDVVLPDSIEYIGYGAFANCGITSINIPKTCIYLGGEALTNNDLEELILPEGLLYLGKFFMDNNPRLTEINIPSSITELCDEFCNGTTHIRKVHFAPNSQIKRVGYKAFYNAKNLIVCELPEGVKEISNYAFYGCSAYGNYKIPSTVRFIGEEAYSGTLGSDSLILPASLREIQDWAFTNVEHLNHVWLGDSLETIGYAVLEAPELHIHLNNITLSQWCLRNNSQMFKSNDGFTRLYINEELIDSGSTLRIPNDVISIKEKAFYDVWLSGVRLVLGDSVKEIGKEAFYRAFLTSLKTNKQLRYIDEYAFANSNYSYYDSFHIMDTVLLESGLEMIKDNSFLGVQIQNLQYNIPYAASNIDAFNRHDYISGYNSPYPKVDSVEFLENVRGIAPNLLYKQENIAIKSWNDSIFSIGEKAFAGCNITSLPDSFPKELLVISSSAFQKAIMAHMPVLNEKLYEISEHAFDEVALNSFYPNERINFPISLMNIGGYAFNNCSFIKRILFSERTQLNEYAFNNCIYLDTIYCTSQTPAICSASAFDGLDKFSCTLCVPAGTKGMYQVATGWRDFYYIQEKGYIVTFVDWDGTILSTEEVQPGENATPPTDPIRDGYTFVGWSHDYTNVQSDLTITAQYQENEPQFTITFVNWDSMVLKNYQVDKGMIPIYDGEEPTRKQTDQYTYKFSGWTPEIEAAYADAIYTATYTESLRKYTVTFVDWNDSILLIEEVEYGGSAISPEDPIRDGYTFVGWDVDFSNIQADLIVKAQYISNITYYNITFINWDQTILQTSQVAEGELPVYTSETPTRPDDVLYTYVFKGWYPEIVPAVADAMYIAMFETKSKSEGIEDIISNGVVSGKILIDNTVFILRGDKIYTLTGQEVR